MIYSAKMPWKKKISLVVMFSGALIEMAFGIARCVAVLTVRSHHPTLQPPWCPTH